MPWHEGLRCWAASTMRSQNPDIARFHRGRCSCWTQTHEPATDGGSALSNQTSTSRTMSKPIAKMTTSTMAWLIQDVETVPERS